MKEKKPAPHLHQQQDIDEVSFGQSSTGQQMRSSTTLGPFEIYQSKISFSNVALK